MLSQKLTELTNTSQMPTNMTRVEHFNTIAEKFIDQEDDLSWINFILSGLLTFYVEHKSSTEIIDKNENGITNKIYFWLNNNKQFRRKVVVNSQPRTDNEETEGYFDLKFQSNYWRENDIHFAIENKILTDTETSFKEYIYYPNKVKGSGENRKIFDDGGMFRFLSNKYAQNQPYACMLAFLKNESVVDIMDKIKNKIAELKIPNEHTFYGELIDKNLLSDSILNFRYSFQTNHIREDSTRIHIFHILFDFRNN